MARVLGLQKPFAEMARFGEKIHTVRPPSKTLPSPGDWRKLYASLRTRQCRAVFPDPVQVAVVEHVTLFFTPPFYLTAVHRECFGYVDPDEFAIADGFDRMRWRAKGAWFNDNKARWVDLPKRNVMCNASSNESGIASTSWPVRGVMFQALG